MIATVLDTETGVTRVSSGIRTWEWSDNNYSCDCNRGLLFGVDNDLCLEERFIVIKAEHTEKDDDPETTLEELNEGYPKELLIKHEVMT